MTFITVGILARNEEQRIVKTIRSLFEQSIFEASEPVDEYRIEVLVVPNGCTDNTAEVAEQVLLEELNRLGDARVSVRVESVLQAGKSNAWNELVHNIASPMTDVFVMLDADIEFGEPGTIRNSVRHLLQSQNAKAVVDLPLNDLTRKETLTPFERLLSMGSLLKFSDPPGIAGSFYCARATTLRDIWMPVGLSGEDGFLYAMILTDCFRSPPDGSRVARASDASHYYEGLTTVRDILRHEVRLAIGGLLNAYLCWHALAFLTDPSGPGAGQLIKQLNQENPNWYARMIALEIASRGRWVFPRGMLQALIRNRFRGWLRRRPVKILMELPYRAGASVLDAAVLFIANRKLRKDSSVGYW